MPKKGYTQTPEHREKLRALRTGKPKSDEHREALSDSLLRYYKRERNIVLRVGMSERGLVLAIMGRKQRR